MRPKGRFESRVESRLASHRRIDIQEEEIQFNAVELTVDSHRVRYFLNNTLHLLKIQEGAMISTLALTIDWRV